MIGIDVIDLTDPLLQNRKNAMRFILHPEDCYPENAQSFWLLWAAKEAIFKAKRESLTFDPRRFPVEITPHKEKYGLQTDSFRGELFVTPNAILAVVNNKNSKKPVFEMLEAHDGASPMKVREALEQHLKKMKLIDTKVITSADRMSVLSHNNLPVSFSHHGRYMAFAYPEF